MHYPDSEVFHIPSYQATFDILHAHTYYSGDLMLQTTR